MGVQGVLRKMQGRLIPGNNSGSSYVEYALPIGVQIVPLNRFLGERIRLEFLGIIRCQGCGTVTSKSYSQGYCFPCSQRLARCDMCQVKPENCHFFQGTCREPSWGEQHCMIPHAIYIANTSGLKVGITRAHNLPGRWIDQGASQGTVIASVNKRLDAGKVEVALKDHVGDKTNWRAMLKGSSILEDLIDRAAALQRYLPTDIEITRPEALSLVTITYPVQQYPEKVKTLGFDREPMIDGILEGIKGQYLLLDSGVLNIRKFTGYQVAFSNPAD